MTREKDYALDLSERPVFAQKQDADLYISIHQNAFERDLSVNGLETFYNSHSNSKNKLLAKSVHTSLISSLNAQDRKYV